tara:strand:- start:50260 stop:51966 length:1707 start_codon:yes stop_codon:yes gene_type:complete
MVGFRYVSYIRYIQRLTIKLISALMCVLALSMPSLAKTHHIPDELYQGMIKFELDSGKYFDSLVLMDEQYQSQNFVNYITALHGFNISNEIPELISGALKQKNLSDADYYQIGRIEYLQDNCIPALKAFKKIKDTSSLEYHEAWSFYRANCFIKLGSNVRAGQALSDAYGGTWAAYAYYNLAIAYSETSRDKTSALRALKIADSFNKKNTKEAKSLNDRINLAAGKIYLDAEKYDFAIPFFKKIHLDSESAPAGLYLNGLALLESGDFRAATQSWHSLKTYPVVDQAVAEAYLAIPYAFERSGYISQTLEAYLDASNTFELELEKIDKLDNLLKEHSVAKIFLENNEIDGLEWFLAKDVVKNTTLAVYHKYIVQDSALYDQFRLFSELSMLKNSLDFWSSQLTVFDESLSNKKKTYKKQRSEFDAPNILGKINAQKTDIDMLQKQSGMTSSLSSNLQLDVLKNSIEVLKIRLDSLQKKVRKGETVLNSQLLESKRLKNVINHANTRLTKLIQALDMEVTKTVRDRLAALRARMVSNFERSEQGRIYLFEGMAESKQVKKRNLLDGRYQ